nr:U-box domain-containing protein 12-like [Ipomoea batatas]
MERKPSYRHQNQRSECESKISGSDKLSDLLRLSENSEHEEDTEEVRRKVEVLEWLKGVTKRLLSNEVDGEAARSTSGIAAPFSLSSAIAIASSLSP